jgi:RNA polymerase sigma-70 factor (ECF subfamily)
VTLAAAQAGDETAFAELVAGHRRELTRHCYRMLGSLDDADEAVQEALLAAWRGLGTFEGRSSIRTWLYRIATRVCLRMAERRTPRILSFDHSPARDPQGDLGQPVTEPVFLDPWPGGPDDPATDVERRETIELAYVAALQSLPANQRAVLILRDVLDFSAAETADLLDTSVASVTSALQRARASTEARAGGPSQQAERLPAEQRGVVDAFVAAFQAADVERMVRLLTTDVRFTMPPLPAWFEGRDAVATFYAQRVFAMRWRQVRVADVNGQPAVLGFSEQDGEFRPSALQVLSFRSGRIDWGASFLDAKLWPRLEVVDADR